MQFHRAREDTEKLIIDAIRSHGKPMTRTEIARAINRKKTPHLNLIIDGLVESEGLKKDLVPVFHNGVEGYVYWLGPAAANGNQKAG